MDRRGTSRGASVIAFGVVGWVLMSAGCGPTQSDAAADEAAASTTSPVQSSTGEGPTTSDAPTMGDTIGDPCVSDLECHNGLVCDGVETCIEGMCVPGQPLDCDDETACTMDACDEAAGGCVHTPDHLQCEAGSLCVSGEGCVLDCVVATCQGHVYACGNCIDDDGDGKVDMHDPDCWGPCDNRESGWKANIPASRRPSPCLTHDCYFDLDGGHGNDDCYWSQRCDPLEPSECAYDPDTNIPGTSDGCAELSVTQSEMCHAYCGPLVPNGCDCFGCCEVPVANGSVTIYLGTAADGHYEGSCRFETANDPTMCHPCTQVEACTNPCETCELCIGKHTLPDGCDPAEQCPGGITPCGLPGQAACPDGSFCNTGCCQLNPV